MTEQEFKQQIKSAAKEIETATGHKVELDFTKGGVFGWFEYDPSEKEFAWPFDDGSEADLKNQQYQENDTNSALYEARMKFEGDEEEFGVMCVLQNYPDLIVWAHADDDGHALGTSDRDEWVQAAINNTIEED